MKKAMLAAGILFAGSQTALAQPACPPPDDGVCANPSDVFVQVDDTGPTPTMYPKDIRICAGNTITWTSNGTRRINVIFPQGLPAQHGHSNDIEYTATTDRNAPRGCYPYEVRIGGQIVDPLIILEK